TDYYDHPFVARFLHLNPRHHSLAFIQTGKNAVHHIMMELFSFDDVGQGYDRVWLSKEDNAKARALRLKNAADGFRRPVQVMDGNYQVMSGVCPWWDSVKAKAAAQ